MRVFTVQSMIWTAALFLAAPAMAQSLDQHRAHCINSNPKTVNLKIAGCTALIESGQLTSANLAAAFNFRGLAYNFLKDDGRAISDYDQAIRINPQYAEAFVSRGITYSRLNDNGRAIADYSAAIRIDAKYADAFTMRGSAYFGMGNDLRAIADFDEAIRIDPEHFLAHYLRGSAKRSLGKIAEGDADIARASAIADKTKRAFLDCSSLFLCLLGA